MMEWDRLISDVRFGLEGYSDPKPGIRSDFQRDYDRLVFSSPFRRLQNKTQVFPLPGSIFVHNRLTHSIEVACVGRSLANEVAIRIRDRHNTGPGSPLDSIGDITAAACLAHDLGNPPFGHSGEMAISTFFSEGEGAGLAAGLTREQWADVTHFDGNANAFRLLTHRFEGRRPGGFAMTYPTLAAIVKYPFGSSLAGDRNKFGFFDSEKDDFIRVADALGMMRLEAPEGTVRYARHPLVYIVEAADDICYEVMDIEDAHKLKLITTDEAVEHLLAFFNTEARTRRIHAMEHVDDPNEQLAYLRSCVIGSLVNACADAFADNEQAILGGTMSGTLLHHIDALPREAYKRCADLSWKKIYTAPDVVDIELAGHRIITLLLDRLIHAVCNPDLRYSRLLLSKVPRQYAVGAPGLYGKIQAVVDYISGMTDIYALDLYRNLNAMSLKINN